VTTASLCGPFCGTPLFAHVFGALVLFGGVAAVVLLAFSALRRPEHAVLLHRTAFGTMLLGVWPGFIVMRIGAQWVASHEGLSNSKATWIGIGFAVSDGGIVVLAVITLLAWLALRRPRAGSFLAGLAAVYLVALGVAWFFMTTKAGGTS
jgi:hypothetical protein